MKMHLYLKRRNKDNFPNIFISHLNLNWGDRTRKFKIVIKKWMNALFNFDMDTNRLLMLILYHYKKKVAFI